MLTLTLVGAQYFTSSRTSIRFSWSWLSSTTPVRASVLRAGVMSPVQLVANVPEVLSANGPPDRAISWHLALLVGLTPVIAEPAPAGVTRTSSALVISMTSAQSVPLKVVLRNEK